MFCPNRGGVGLRVYQNYLADLFAIRWSRIDDGVMRFESCRPVDRGRIRFRRPLNNALRAQLFKRRGVNAESKPTRLRCAHRMSDQATGSYPEWR
jgi:hypothetical protein